MGGSALGSCVSGLGFCARTEQAATGAWAEQASASEVASGWSRSNPGAAMARVPLAIQSSEAVCRRAVEDSSEPRMDPGEEDRTANSDADACSVPVRLAVTPELDLRWGMVSIGRAAASTGVGVRGSGSRGLACRPRVRPSSSAGGVEARARLRCVASSRSGSQPWKAVVVAIVPAGIAWCTPWSPPCCVIEACAPMCRVGGARGSGGGRRSQGLRAAMALGGRASGAVRC